MDPITQEANSVEVEIFDRVFNLPNLTRGIDPGHIRQLAAYVDLKMRTFADGTDTVHRAVYAALDIANEIHRLKTSEEETAKEADSSDSLVGEVGQPRKPFTEEDKSAQNRERRQRHYTKRRYERELLAIANGDVVPTKEQHDALLALGRSRGYHRRPTGKR